MSKAHENATQILTAASSRWRGIRKWKRLGVDIFAWAYGHFVTWRIDGSSRAAAIALLIANSEAQCSGCIHWREEVDVDSGECSKIADTLCIDSDYGWLARRDIVPICVPAEFCCAHHEGLKS